MEISDRTANLETSKDFKVNVKSKKILVYQLTKYESLLKKLLDGQSQFPEDDKKKLLEETLKNFQLAVQENIVVDGLSWQEAPEEDEDCTCSALNDLLDEKIVQTSMKRSIYPKKILPYVVRCLKAERKLMDLFETGVKPQELRRDTVKDATMTSVSETAPRLFTQVATVMKSLQALQQTAEGLEQVLHMQLSADAPEVYGDALDRGQGEPRPRPANTHSIKQAVSETDHSMDYIAAFKTPASLFS